MFALNCEYNAGMVYVQGEVRRNRKLRVGMYSQHFQDLLDFEKSPVQYLVDKYDKKYQEVRNKLGKFGLEGHAHTIPIKDLSGGQKARVVFAGACAFLPSSLQHLM
jgi:ATP-binding cassette subfamily F protein 1